MFQKTSQNRIYQDLVDQIQGAILDGRLNPGDKLPPQREMVEMFQTSRSTLREAIRVLEQKGLIEVKLGVSGGAIVKEADPEKIVESLSLLMQHQKVTFNDLSEFREGVEGCVATLAAERVKEKDIILLRELLGKAGKHLGNLKTELKDYFHADLKIHMAIAEIAGNPVYIAVLHMVHNNILDNYIYEDEEGLKEAYTSLCEIVDAIEAGDAERARTLVQKHIVLSTRSIRDAHPDSVYV